jgi:hypothetical protein
MDINGLEEFAFEGAFKDVQFLVSNIDELTRNKILVLTDDYQHGDNVINPNDSDVLELPFYTKKGSYHLNEIITQGIYARLQWIIEGANEINIWDLNEYYGKLLSIVSISDKIKFLEDSHKELFADFENFSEYMLYIMNNSCNGFDTWQELMYYIIEREEQLIIDYLTVGLHNLFVDNDIFTSWTLYYRTKTLSEFITLEIDNLKGIHPSMNDNEDINTVEKTLLIDRLLGSSEKWANTSDLKKAKIISAILGTSIRNISKTIASTAKKSADCSKSFNDAQSKIIEFLKKIKYE